MEIKYIVANLEVSGSGLSTNKEFYFDTVEQAIEFKEKQKVPTFSWWEIIVDYTKDT